LNTEIKSVSEQIESTAKDDERAKLIMTIPGVSYYYSALLIASEIGDMVDRFPDSDHLRGILR
jgi:hypothetical protein